jgi:hypothetical protein
MTATEHFPESRLTMSPDLKRAAERAAAAAALSGAGLTAAEALDVSPKLRGKALANLGSTNRSETSSRLALGDMLPGLDGTAERAVSLFGGKAGLVVGANVQGGAWHYSPGTIKKFRGDKVSKGGKFGPGTYLGVGTLAGETVDGLKAGGARRHDVGFTGNILVLSREDVQEVASVLKERKGIPPSKFTTTIKNAPLTTYVEGLDFEGAPVDAVMVYMDSEQTSAEIAVLPHATERLAVTGIE